MILPSPKSALGRAIERALVLALSAILSAVLVNVSLTPVVYFVLKSALDLINSNVPNL